MMRAAAGLVLMLVGCLMVGYAMLPMGVEVGELEPERNFYHVYVIAKTVTEGETYLYRKCNPPYLYYFYSSAESAYNYGIWFVELKDMWSEFGEVENYAIRVKMRTVSKVNAPEMANYRIDVYGFTASEFDSWIREFGDGSVLDKIWLPISSTQVGVIDGGEYLFSVETKDFQAVGEEYLSQDAWEGFWIRNFWFEVGLDRKFDYVLFAPGFTPYIGYVQGWWETNGVWQTHFELLVEGRAYRKIYGTVYDTDNADAKLDNVKIEYLYGFTTSDENGYFEISVLEGDNYGLTFWRDGYVEKKVRVEVLENDVRIDVGLTKVGEFVTVKLPHVLLSLGIILIGGGVICFFVEGKRAMIGGRRLTRWRGF